jgi:hypothetical protein
LRTKDHGVFFLCPPSSLRLKRPHLPVCKSVLPPVFACLCTRKSLCAPANCLAFPTWPGQYHRNEVDYTSQNLLYSILQSTPIFVFVFLCSVRRLLVTANVFPSSPILVTLIMEALRSSETSVLRRTARRNIPEDTHSSWSTP